jgi:Domain of unknown function (DUF1992)
LIGAAVDKPNPLKLLDDHIGRHLRESEAVGELRPAPSFGKPLRFNDGYDETPREWRMAMKILHDAGVVPPEVGLLHQLAALRRDAAAASDAEQARALAEKASELEQGIRLRRSATRAARSEAGPLLAAGALHPGLCQALVGQHPLHRRARQHALQIRPELRRFARWLGGGPFEAAGPATQHEGVGIQRAVGRAEQPGLPV